MDNISMDDTGQNAKYGVISDLERHFPRDGHYLLKQSHPGMIDQWIKGHVYDPFQRIAKHKLWGTEVKDVPMIGRWLGWVPDHFPFMFFSDRVVQEIADCMAVRNERVSGDKEDRMMAMELLSYVGLTDLAPNHPFFLSEGETKVIWLLCQWVKCPEYFIIGHLPSGLSENRLKSCLAFLLDSQSPAHSMGFSSTTFILGYLNDDPEWYGCLMAEKNWKLVKPFTLT